MKKTIKKQCVFIKIFLFIFFISIFHVIDAQSQNECVSKEQFEEILSLNKSSFDSKKYQSEQNMLLSKLVKMDRPCLFAQLKNTPNYSEKQIEQAIYKVINHPKNKQTYYVTDELYFLLKTHFKSAKTLSTFKPISDFHFE